MCGRERMGLKLDIIGLRMLKPYLLGFAKDQFGRAVEGIDLKRYGCVPVRIQHVYLDILSNIDQWRHGFISQQRTGSIDLVSFGARLFPDTLILGKARWVDRARVRPG